MSIVPSGDVHNCVAPSALLMLGIMFSNKFPAHHIWGTLPFLLCVDGGQIRQTPTSGDFPMHFSVEEGPAEASNIFFGWHWFEMSSEDLEGFTLQRDVSNTH